MQENTESKKSNEAQTPENEECLSDEKTTSESSESSEPETSREEQEGKVLPSEKKKSSRYGLFLLILLLLVGGSSYLLYTDQIPPQIKKWIEPLLKPLKQQLAIIQPASEPPRPPKKLILETKEKVTDPTIQKETLIVEKKSVPEITPSPSKEAPNSDSQTKTIPEVEEAGSNYPDKVAGTPFIEPKLEALAEEIKAETIPEESEKIEADHADEIVAPPVLTTIPHTQTTPEIEEPKFSEAPTQLKKNQKNKAVQAYLDFFEATLIKISKLIKAGFVRGKDFLIKSFD